MGLLLVQEKYEIKKEKSTKKKQDFWLWVAFIGTAPLEVYLTPTSELMKIKIVFFFL